MTRRKTDGLQVPEETPNNARCLMSESSTGRVYAIGSGDRIRIESADGRMAYSLPTVPDDAHQEAQDGFAALVAKLAREVDKRGARRPQRSRRSLEIRPGKPLAPKEFAPAEYGPGAMLAWSVDGIAYTGQVWANRVRSGDWNGRRGATSAVVVATVGGRRARRDEAVCLPLVHGQKPAHAFVATPGGHADVEAIAPQRAADGLFDMVTTASDPVEEWEAEGGYLPGAEPAEPAAEPADAVEAAPTEGPGDDGTAAPIPAGRHCPRCDRNALYGIECSYCGHVIITALAVKPCHPPAWSPGCCPKCFTTEPEVWEINGRLLCTVCAEGRSRWGARVQAASGWRERARRVVGWADNAGELSYATAYGDDAPEGGPAALPDVVSPK